MARECDGCTVCCTLTRVPELDKPVGVTCPFACNGCTIYKDRPQSCRNFNCAWVMGDMPTWMKPNKSHVMIEKLPGISVVLALPEKDYEKTWKTDEIVAVLKEEYVSKGISVVAGDNTALLAEGATVEGVKSDVMRVAKTLGVA